MYISTIKTTAKPIHLFWVAQIASLQCDKALTKVSPEYSNYTNIFSLELIIELSKCTSIIKHAIKLIEEKQPSNIPIYAFTTVELETLKTYIETHLKTGFIQVFKSLISFLILFNNKTDGSLYLCIDYQSLNNLTIKNQYFLPLIGESLDELDQPKGLPS